MVADTVTLAIPVPKSHRPLTICRKVTFWPRISALVRTFICSTSFTIYGHNFEGIYICTANRPNQKRGLSEGGLWVASSSWMDGFVGQSGNKKILCLIDSLRVIILFSRQQNPVTYVKFNALPPSTLACNSPHSAMH